MPADSQSKHIPFCSSLPTSLRTYLFIFTLTSRTTVYKIRHIFVFQNLYFLSSSIKNRRKLEQSNKDFRVRQESRLDARSKHLSHTFHM